MVSDDIIDIVVQAFRALSDPTRVKMIHALSTEELCVCDLARLLGVTESAVSHQLRLLRSQRLVKHRRKGKMIYYTLDDDHIRTLFAQGLEHAKCPQGR
ncbi:winged helix-turn-helix transcriptional regulator [bacterium]|nr:winged helix-turn-helix transcriptional regulator [bacterium]